MSTSPPVDQTQVAILQGQVATYEAVLSGLLPPDSAATRRFLFNVPEGLRESRDELGLSVATLNRVIEFCSDRAQLLENQVTGGKPIGRR